MSDVTAGHPASMLDIPHPQPEGLLRTIFPATSILLYALASDAPNVGHWPLLWPLVAALIISGAKALNPQSERVTLRTFVSETILGTGAGIIVPLFANELKTLTPNGFLMYALLGAFGGPPLVAVIQTKLFGKGDPHA